MTDETTTLIAPTLQETQNEPPSRQEANIPSGRLGNDFFGIENKEEVKTDAQKPTNGAVETTTPIVDQPKKEEPKIETPPPTVEWIKEFGWENEEAAKAEIKKLKETPPATEYKFENEESKKLAEAISKGDRKTVLSILETQEKLESLTAAEVNDSTAEAIIKLSMQLKSKANGVELSSDEVNYKYNKEFGLPKEPQPKDDDLEGEYEARKAAWQEQVNDIKMNRNIEAKLAKPELDKLKTQIVLPDISQSSAQRPPTQEELDAVKRYNDNYVQSVDNSIKDFNGFSVVVKNEAVGLPETPIEYSVVDTEKVSLAKEMKDFVQKKFSAM